MLARVRGLSILSCLLAAALFISACGGSSSSGGSSFAKTAPSQIVQDAQSAMSDARSFQAGGQISLGGQQSAATIQVSAPSDIAATIQRGKELVKLTIVGSASYLYANSTFWQQETHATSAAAVSAFANRWYKAPATTTKSLVSDLGDVSPKQLAVCLGKAAGSAKVAGTPTIDGTDTVELKLSDGTPGASPGNLYVAASAPHYPIRFQQTGKGTAGGSGPCANSPISANNQKSTLDFSKWNQVSVTAPANASALP